MVDVDLKALVSRLNRFCTRALETAAGTCVARTHYEVTVEHVFHALLSEPNADVQAICSHYGVSAAVLEKAVLRALEDLKSGNSGRPVFSPTLLEWFQKGWLLASLDHSLSKVRSGILLRALLENQARLASADYMDLFSEVPKDELKRQVIAICETSAEADTPFIGEKTIEGGGKDGKAPGAHSRDPESALGKFCTDFTARARAGQVDPVFGRDAEIRQMIDILARRRKNNPICCGEAGVGKTAVVEGLALRMAENDVPDLLKGVDLLGLDMGLLQAGASVKGEFENRLKNVIQEVKESPKPIVMFIDEAHTLIGAGGQVGGGDAANLLKPALARGELRTVAATTWSEYKKYFEKDAALARRFQVVKLDEPDDPTTVTMLRGVRGKFEASHGVIIRDDALVACAALGSRYITGRNHPDKAVDLMDTAAARVKISLSTKPGQLDDLERELASLERELNALKRDQDAGAPDTEERIEELGTEIADQERAIQEMTERWQAERGAANRVVAIRTKLQGAPLPTDEPVDEADKFKEAKPAEGETADIEKTPETPADPVEQAKVSHTLQIAQMAKTLPDDPEALKVELKAALDNLRKVQGEDPLLAVEVTPEVIARVISDWTGIPIGNMVKDEASALLAFEDTLGKRIKGQDHVLSIVGETIRSAKSGVKPAETPIGVFLFVGPSGVGKTETALGVADLLFGGERMMTTINMSEFQEKHTVSRLIGSPPGYVGYGEGGVLTEGVRQRPYSVVLLDECEKADPEVLNLFYQVFDKGQLSDGEGREVDFKNTVIFLTSNLCTDDITRLGLGDKNAEHLAQIIRDVLAKPERKKDDLDPVATELYDFFNQLGESPFKSQVGEVVMAMKTAPKENRDLSEEEIEKAKELQAALDHAAQPVGMDDLVQAIRPQLSKYFKPALLARMTLVPFFPLNPEALQKITVLKLNKLKKRLAENHKLETVIDDSVINAIASRCTEVETGARNVDHIMRGTLLPQISKEILSQMTGGELPNRLTITYDDASGDFQFAFSNVEK